jgi:hypothetical protein
LVCQSQDRLPGWSDQLSGAGYIARRAEEPMVRAVLQYRGRTEIREPPQVARFGIVQ